MTTRRVAIWQLPTGLLFTFKSRAAQQWFTSVVILLFIIQRILWRIGDTLLLIFIGVGRFMSCGRHDRRHNDLEVNNVFNNPLAAASISKYLAIFASHAPPTTFLSSSNITCSTTFYSTDWTPLGTLWSDLCEVLSSSSPTLVRISFATNPFLLTSLFVWSRRHCR